MSQFPFPAVSNATLSGADAVFRGVLEAISRQRLVPGTKLQEENLAQIFTVSRAQVRTALLRLKQRGLVEMKPKHTAAVARPSVEEVRSIFALRRWIEPEIASEVAGKFAKKHELALKAHLDQEQSARERGDRIEATRLAGLFHSAICACSDNLIAAGYVSELVDRSFLAIYLYQRAGELMCVNDEHFALAAAFKSKDFKKARHLMGEHLDHILKRMDLVQSENTSTDLSQAFRGLV